MLLPSQFPPIIRATNAEKLLTQSMVIASAERMIIAKNTYLQCQLCCSLNGGDACRRIPHCACPISDLVA